MLYFCQWKDWTANLEILVLTVVLIAIAFLFNFVTIFLEREMWTASDFD